MNRNSYDKRPFLLYFWSFLSLYLSLIEVFPIHTIIETLENAMSAMHSFVFDISLNVNRDSYFHYHGIEQQNSNLFYMFEYIKFTAVLLFWLEFLRCNPKPIYSVCVEYLENKRSLFSLNILLTLFLVLVKKTLKLHDRPKRYMNALKYQ